MLNLRPFEIVLISVFFAFAIGALVYVSLFKSTGNTDDKQFGEKVVIWGPFSSGDFNQFLTNIASSNKSFSSVTYKQVDERNFNGELLNAIAEGKSPDLIIIPHTALVTLRQTLRPISYVDYPIRNFKDTYIDGAEIFMRDDGIYGIPFAVDPLIMYWNRDIFSSSGLSGAPRTWETLVSETTPAIVRRDEKLQITQSAVAFGEYVNVQHAKDILSMLFLQSGTNIVEEQNGRYAITLGRGTGNGLPPGEAALSFYTQFVAPGNTAYSWNRSQVLDRSQFLGGTLAMYFGFGSELSTMLKENPNLNIDIAPVPQGSGATTLRNYGTFYAFAVPRASLNFEGAKKAAFALATPEYSDILASKFELAPVQRSLLGNGSTDSYRSILYQAALVSRGWLDPSPLKTGDAFREMVESVTTGRARVSQTLSETATRIELLFK